MTPQLQRALQHGAQTPQTALHFEGLEYHLLVTPNDIDKFPPTPVLSLNGRIGFLSTNQILFVFFVCFQKENNPPVHRGFKPFKI